jgi:transcriptional regulator with XRE-family HTH domain
MKRANLQHAITTRYGTRRGYLTRAARGLNATCRTTLTPSYLSMLVNGYRLPGLLTAYRISRHFQVDIPILFSLGEAEEGAIPNAQ